MSNAILCYADRYCTTRGIVTLATALANDPADTILVTTPEDKKTIEHITPLAINVISIDDILAKYGLTRAMLSNDCWMYRIPCVKYLFDMEYENVLALDSDCLVLGKINEVWEKAKSNTVAACSDLYGILGDAESINTVD